MSDQAAPHVPPGWYPDAQAAGGYRWWDGTGWTEHRSGPAASSPIPAAIPEDAWPYVGQATPHLTVPLWAPLYGATMGDAWRRFWRKYTDFSGRASRSEFWFAYLWIFILLFGSYLVFAALVAGIAAAAASGGDGSVSAALGIGMGVIGLLWVAGYIAVMIPFIAVAIRRLHDAGYPGTYFLMGLIPFAGGILLLVYLATESRAAGMVYDLPRD
ncbi:MAG: DUF805 domain-containing protein [Protaetiibacter sp.]